MSRLRPRAIWFLSAAALPWVPAHLSAQTRDSAHVVGRVLDERGEAVAEAAVSLTNTSTGLERSARTETDGSFAFAGLPVTGKYALQVSKSGFREWHRKEIELRAGETASFELTLSVGRISATVIVYGTKEGVQADSSQVETRLDLEKLDHTPVLGRKLTSLALLDSAVRPARGTGYLFLKSA